MKRRGGSQQTAGTPGRREAVAMKTLLSLLGCALCFASGPAAARADDVSHRAAAEELLKTMRLDEQQAKQVEQVKTMVAGMTASAAQGQNAPLKPEQVAEAQKVQAQMLDLIFQKMSWEAIKPEFVQAYVEVFTEPELKDLIAFYRSPAGQKYVEKQPQLTAKVMQISQKRAMELMPEIQALARKRTQSSPSPTATGEGK